MQFAHNGYYKGSILLGLNIIYNSGKFKGAFGRVWFMALVLKTSTFKKSRRFKSDNALIFILFKIYRGRISLMVK